MTTSVDARTSSVSDQNRTEVSVDVIVIGGGIAGLWTHARLLQKGYHSVLLESDALGSGQTRYAQGIIHGGTKYALTGKLTASSEAVADMPSRWRACFKGEGEIDLTQAELLSDAHYLWSTASLTSKISGFFASKVMRSRSSAVKPDDDGDVLPSVFKNKKFKGQFYRLDEPVFNTLSVIRAIAEPIKKSILPIQQESIASHNINSLNPHLLVKSNDEQQYCFQYKKIIFMAGQGNEGLLKTIGRDQPLMQLRPLKMVVMRGKKGNQLTDMVYVHCLGASVNPRLTITSHRDKSGNIIWYMGGQLAEDGVDKSDDDLITIAKKEIDELIPVINTKNVEWAVLKIDRAELQNPQNKRPDTFSVEQYKNLITAWPTKMALSPALADEIISIIHKDNIQTNLETSLPSWAKINYADFPWDEDIHWRQL